MRVWAGDGFDALAVTRYGAVGIGYEGYRICTERGLRINCGRGRCRVSSSDSTSEAIGTFRRLGIGINISISIILVLLAACRPH